MRKEPRNPYDALERIFHEPNRLAIMSVVCAADQGVSFTELKAACDLTDGNLNRHLKVLEETGAVAIKKTFVKAMPRTTIHMTKGGLERFNEYLAALSDVLKQAKRSLPAEKRSATAPLGRTVRT